MQVSQPVPEAEMRGELDRILASPEFRNSERRSRLLEYLVNKVIAGEQINEYAIGVDVFGKPADYDPRLDPAVRVEIGRTRQRLADYYAAGGKDNPLRIEIPRRSHVPVFHAVAEASPEPGPEPRSEPGPELRLEPVVKAQPVSSRSRRPRIAIAAALGLLSCAIWLLAKHELPRKDEIHSVVVLPFQNLTADPQNDYLADGIAEDLTDRLARVSNLRVVARSSAFQFKGKAADVRDIGRRVAADAVIEGSLRSANGVLQVTAHVSRAADGYQIFSHIFEGRPKDLARLENDMAGPVLASIQPRAAIPKRAAPDPEAYDLFLKARAYRGDGTRAASDRAIAYLHQSIERDPHFADAYAALAGVYAADAVSLAANPVDYAQSARAAADKALELDPDSGPAFSALGLVDSLILLDWKRGEEELRRSIALMPQAAAAHNRLGLLLIAQGRFQEAISELERAATLDPLATAPGVTVGLAHFMSRDYDEALRRFTEVRDLHPDSVLVHSYIGLAWEGKNRFDRALNEYTIVRSKLPAAGTAPLAHLLARMGQKTKALELLHEIQHPADQPANPFDVAVVYTALGDRDAALEWLERAYQRRLIWFLRVHPFLDPLRGDPRFDALIKKAGLG